MYQLLKDKEYNSFQEICQGHVELGTRFLSCKKNLLIHALEQGDVGVVEYFLQCKVINFTNSKDQTILHHAARYNNMDIIIAILHYDLSLINKVDSDGNTALNYAVKVDLHIVKLLLEKGADVNIRNHSRKFPEEHDDVSDEVKEAIVRRREK